MKKFYINFFSRALITLIDEHNFIALILICRFTNFLWSHAWIYVFLLILSDINCVENFYKGTFSSQEISQTRRMKKNLLEFLFDGSFIRLLISSIAQLMEKFFLCYEFFLLSLCDRFRCPFKLSIYDWSSYLDLISFYDHSTRMKRWFKAIRERDFFYWCVPVQKLTSHGNVCMQMCKLAFADESIYFKSTASVKKVSFPFNNFVLWPPIFF